MELLVENIRCFAGLHQIPIRPLTLLVGENSSGKSTLLALLSVLHDHRGFPDHPDFNNPPYGLGSFETICTKQRGQTTEDKTFGLGFVRSEASRVRLNQVFRRVHVKYRSEGNGPQACGVECETQRHRVTIGLQGSALAVRVARLEDSLPGVSRPLAERFPATDRRRLFSSLLDLKQPLEAWLEKLQGQFAADVLRDVVPKLWDLRPSEFLPVSLAPIRSEPRRTYDDLSPVWSPEGADVPYVLRRVLADESSGDEAEKLNAAIRQFGVESGMFDAVEVKRFEKHGGPFQIRVKQKAGGAHSLLDVGYGVSQSLPLIVRATLGSGPTMCLIQQPEVHLHARPQAALGSFFARIAAKERRIVVETHSDHLVDRVRWEIAQGTLAHDDVSLLFLDRVKGQTAVHRIELDDRGNILEPPANYREFFLAEMTRMLDRVP